MMTLGERCDEIVRLIEETLADCTTTTPATPAMAAAGAETLGAVVEPPMVARVRALAETQRLPRSA